MALAIISLAVMAGICLCSAAPLVPVLAAVAILLSGLIPFMKRRPRVAIAVFSLIAVALGAVRYELSRPVVDDYSIVKFNDGVEVAVRGTVARDPEKSGKTLRLYVSLTEKNGGWKWYEVSGNVLVFAPEYADYRYGDVLEIVGKPETPTVFEDFDYRQYLADRQIYTTMLYPKITIIERDKGSQLLAALYSWRKDVGGSLARALPEPQAALAQGILLGTRGNIPPEVKAYFRDSGATHVLAISGANLSIIAAMLAAVFTWIFGKRRGIYVYLTAGIIWAYAVFTGLEPPVMRGAVMASLFLTAELLGRQKSAFPALAFSGTVMALADPAVLWDVSFQLSFMAMAGLILIYPPFSIIGRRLIGKFLGEKGAIPGIAVMINDGVAASLSATVAVFPLTVNYFGALSLAAVPATLLALPALPPIIVLGAVTGLSGLFFPAAAQVIGWLAWLPLTYLLDVVKIAAEVPDSHIAVDSLSPGVVAAYYSVLLLVLALAEGRLARLKADAAKVRGFMTPGRVKLAVMLFVLVAALSAAAFLTWPDGRLHVAFLDVGQGDAILIRQGGRTVLVDGGPDSQSVLNALSDQLPFWDRDIDLIVLTHPDADHITGLIEVIDRYDVGRVICPPGSFDSQAGEAWLDLINSKKIRPVTAGPGQRVTAGDITIDVVLPERAPDDTGADAGSVALRVGRGKISFLLTADITSATELELMLERANLECTVLKVAHHGSAHGTSAGFLAVAGPDAAVISVGKDNRFGHPAPEVLERLEAAVGKENIYRTDLNGTIEFITDGERLWVKKEK